MPTVALSAPHKRVPGMGKLDLRDMLLVAGTPQYTADMSIPYMNFLPGTCEPYAQGVQQIVKGLQRLLNARGGHLKVDGGLGNETLAELVKYAGPRWYDKSWSQLYLDVLAGERWKGWIRNGRQPGNLEADAAYNPLMRGMGGVVDDAMQTPLPWIAAGAALAWWWTKKGRR